MCQSSFDRMFLLISVKCKIILWNADSLCEILSLTESTYETQNRSVKFCHWKNSFFKLGEKYSVATFTWEQASTKKYLDDWKVNSFIY
jgi:hypothetical protein